jgi:hypothetical protein
MLVRDQHLTCKPLVDAWQFVNVGMLCNLFLCADLRSVAAITTTTYASFACDGIDLPSLNNLSIIICWVMIFVLLL